MKLKIAAVSAVAVLALAGCSSGASTSESASATPSVSASSAPVEMTGTWTGESKYAKPDGGVAGGPETLVIERQEGSLLWGYAEYTDTDGTKVKQTITGTVVEGGDVLLTEPTAKWSGQVEGNEAMFVVSWADSATEHSAFRMDMKKQ